MAISNYDRVGKALELLRDGLRPFVARELEARHGQYWITAVTASWPNELTWKEGEDAPQMDAAVLLRMMWDQWNGVFKDILGFSENQVALRCWRAEAHLSCHLCHPPEVDQQALCQKTSECTQSTPYKFTRES